MNCRLSWPDEISVVELQALLVSLALDRMVVVEMGDETPWLKPICCFVWLINLVLKTMQHWRFVLIKLDHSRKRPKNQHNIYIRRIKNNHRVTIF